MLAEIYSAEKEISKSWCCQYCLWESSQRTARQVSFYRFIYQDSAILVQYKLYMYAKISFNKHVVFNLQPIHCFVCVLKYGIVFNTWLNGLINCLLLSLFTYSYKLWYNYLKGLRAQAKGKCINDRIYEDVNNAFERALVFMHKVPTVVLFNIVVMGKSDSDRLLSQLACLFVSVLSHQFSVLQQV